MSIMTADRRLPRRAFLGVASAVMLAGPAALHRLWSPVPTHPPSPEAWWRDLWSDEPSTRIIGRACVAAVCEEGDAAALAAAITLRVPGITARSVRARRAAIGARVRQDFAEGHTVWVDGWLLSDT